MRQFSSLILLSIFILFLSTGCSVKKPQTPQEQAKLEKPKPQTNVKKLEYYKADSMLVDSTPPTLEEILEKEPAAVGEFQPALSAEEAAAQITEQALKAKNGKRALPLFAHWDTGAKSDLSGMSPDFMLTLIEQGHHALVSWELDPYWASYIPLEYYEDSIKRAAELNLPLVFVAGSYALPMLEDPDFYGKKDLIKDGALSPIGSVKYWSEAGKRWMKSDLLKQLQAWYPNPPLVVFLSRNDTPRLPAAEYDMDNKAYGDAWFERYRALQDAAKSNLTKAWSENTIFVGHNSFVNPDMGKTDDWMQHDETTTEGTLSVWPLIYDGASVDFVIGEGEDDTSLNSPHASANSLPFMLEDTKFLNNDFWWEATIGATNILGDAERYRGFTQFDLWLNRPAVLREAATDNEDNKSIMAHFVELIDSVEMVHKSDILKDFWENGTLVKNPNVTNPHDKNIPEMYRGELGWYMLDTDAQGVWAFALELGKEPNRYWLLFAQSSESKEEAYVTIPSYKDVEISTSASGEFYVISEEESNTTKHTRSLPSSAAQITLIDTFDNWKFNDNWKLTADQKVEAGGSFKGLYNTADTTQFEFEIGLQYEITINASNVVKRTYLRNPKDKNIADYTRVLKDGKNIFTVNVASENKHLSLANLDLDTKITIDSISIRKLDETINLNILPDVEIPDFLPSGYELVWADEFNRNSLNTNAWTHRNAKRGDAISTENNLKLKDGKLIITIDEKNGVYRTADITTEEVVDSKISGNKVEFLYGYFEAKMKLPKGEGNNPSFWMNSKGMVQGILNDLKHGGAEIDIFEHSALHPDEAVHTIWINGYGTERESIQKFPKIVGIDEEWHTYGVLWEREHYIFYIDGKETARITRNVSASPEYLCLSNNVHMNSAWLGDIRNNQDLPTTFEVEYVRVFQKK
jgi:hypothetical protein